MNCVFCKSSELERFLDLGHIPLVDKFLSVKELSEPEIFYPLNVCLCKNCGLSQLGYKIPPEKLFNKEYAYESSTTKTRRDNYSELAEITCKIADMKKNELVIDIGSNVGVLLNAFKNLGMRTLGVDASENIVTKANDNGINTMLGFFDESITEKILLVEGKAKIVTATNVFAHIQDYDSFMFALKKILNEDGVFMFHVPHFLHLIKNLEYDTVYHEHVCYFGLKPLIMFFKKFNMEIFEVLESELDGGSIRCFVCHKDKRQISKNIKNILEKENKENIYSISRLHDFNKQVLKQKNDLLKLLIDLKHNNKRIVGLSAPAKGITLLNYCKIDNSFLEYITEKAPLKIHKYTPGMHQHVVSDENLITDKPDYALILAWNFSDEIILNLKEFKDAGGKFIIPIPTPKII